MISNPVTSPLSGGEGIGGSADGASVVRVVSALVVGGEVVRVVDGAAVVRVVDGAAVVRVVDGAAVVRVVDGAAVVRVVEGVATSADSCSSETAATVSVPSP